MEAGEGSYLSFPMGGSVWVLDKNFFVTVMYVFVFSCSVVSDSL